MAVDTLLLANFRGCTVCWLHLFSKQWQAVLKPSTCDLHVHGALACAPAMSDMSPKQLTLTHHYKSCKGLCCRANAHRDRIPLLLRGEQRWWTMLTEQEVTQRSCLSANGQVRTGVTCLDPLVYLRGGKRAAGGAGVHKVEAPHTVPRQQTPHRTDVHAQKLLHTEGFRFSGP